MKLLKEEMRRTLEFLKWKSASWLAKVPSSASQKSTCSSFVLEGLAAYALRQADVFLSIHAHFLSLWSGLTALDSLADKLPPIHMQTEDAMQGVDGGDI